MTQKEMIINLLNTNGTMTQGALAEAIYGDKNHAPNIYASLTSLVTGGIVLRTGSHPSHYSLSGSEVVNEIARSNGKINLFSFASKYCCYHNRNLYGRDDYSILDTVLNEYLPRYFDDITKSQIQKWQNDFDYKSYNDYITRKLDVFCITVEHRKRKFDHFVWYKNR